ncbi:hypothetical protein [Streptacidiphilus jiangxiensis]|uniref:WXG100 family type VII secretion target n=1 Tax=Streptacidiphilus jiangxiensis TaxID=235985 RepID=A0A1H7P573_STRJI|nr:hypothetical protein [Streptacidiphilus jiangxiensis]SEL30912.1 hypothetical protein SAMN05414137_107227 [Streptacidiphilus jiangxiensis]
MGNESFEVNTEGLQNQLPYLRELAARFRGIGTELEAKLGSLGQPWGDDETGQQFLESYDNPHRQILDGISQTGEVLDSTGDGIDTMAKNYRILEEENIAAARTLDTGSGGSDHPTPTHPTTEKP